ncbi:uncharacterized protein L969DRAFT_17771 [Mixia osmundae IAM 14324]|uniref:HSF-type DNA-binding domain-containing protein n=1 Tax=Mixia osmundae (strain CBS 9802 / IAM 14324 / JCM 22182 / KY 12970) TaxID=764103 RepID=G7E211_MIXOS|nr:uncharacterized protein L969DRAFT_17771 [Mixia osmundae IAM 14324]KEI38693.1 hypothetical protein L969DRAFT_17771 [Mixia osmundae IAM 14324]GAA96848.1 hypothetical protein E5Q_03521 [Mixia osmundae IAM 14324]
METIVQYQHFPTPASLDRPPKLVEALHHGGPSALISSPLASYRPSLALATPSFTHAAARMRAYTTPTEPSQPIWPTPDPCITGGSDATSVKQTPRNRSRTIAQALVHEIEVSAKNADSAAKAKTTEQDAQVTRLHHAEAHQVQFPTPVSLLSCKTASYTAGPAQSHHAHLHAPIATGSPPMSRPGRKRTSTEVQRQIEHHKKRISEMTLLKIPARESSERSTFVQAALASPDQLSPRAWRYHRRTNSISNVVPEASVVSSAGLSNAHAPAYAKSALGAPFGYPAGYSEIEYRHAVPFVGSFTARIHSGPTSYWPTPDSSRESAAYNPANFALPPSPTFSSSSAASETIERPRMRTKRGYRASKIQQLASPPASIASSDEPRRSSLEDGLTRRQQRKASLSARVAANARPRKVSPAEVLPIKRARRQTRKVQSPQAEDDVESVADEDEVARNVSIPIEEIKMHESDHEGGTMKFTQTMWNALSTDAYYPFLRWDPVNGANIMVRMNSREMHAKFLAVHFGHQNPASFQRQLNVYSFRRLPRSAMSVILAHPKMKGHRPDEWAGFHNEFFHRSHKELLSKIRPQAKSGRAANKRRTGRKSDSLPPITKRQRAMRSTSKRRTYHDDDEDDEDQSENGYSDGMEED